MLIAGTVSLLALPSAVLAFTADFSSQELSSPTLDGTADTADAPAFSRALTIRSLAKGQLFPFTPAGARDEATRSVTVAVRVDPATAEAITVRGRSMIQPDSEATRLRIAPTGFNLGVSRGYRNFTQDIARQAAGPALSSETADLHAYSLAPSRNSGNSRFSSRVTVDDRPVPGRSPRTFSVDGSDVDLGGAYRVTDNLNVTAGVRYSQERDRLAPLTDGKQDSQAVYVGTQFSF